MKQPDYIVVGGGSSGCVMAHRLAHAGHEVLLLEDGPADNTMYIKMPATFVRVIGTERTFVYESMPQPGLNNRISYIPQGHTLGGGSAVNAMIYVRGQREDYNEWAEQAGCTGWAWDDVLPFFKRAENHQRLSGPLHGNDGPLIVSDPRHRHPLSSAFVKSAQQIGLKYNDDFNGEKQEGIGFYHTTTFGGTRGSTARTYLAAARKLPNLTVQTGCSVQKLLLDDNLQAKGVAYKQNGKLVEVNASKEIVLCAGALATPKILMHSGIGPRDQLEKHGIKVRLDRPEIGQNFQDHLEVGVFARTKDPISMFGEDKGLKALNHGIEWTIYKQGLLTSTVVETGGFVDTTGDGRPDIQFHVTPAFGGDIDRNPYDGHGMTINPCFLRPKSRGQATLQSANPEDPLLLDSASLKEQEDVDTLVRGVKVARQILRAPALAALIKEELRPGPDAEMSDADLEQHVRNHAKTVYHPACTCRMGTDEGAIVNTKLQVNGVKGLRIADASVMPSLVSGNTNAPVVMIAERCADFMLNS